jgi:hypothetical protein
MGHLRDRIEARFVWSFGVGCACPPMWCCCHARSEDLLCVVMSIMLMKWQFFRRGRCVLTFIKSKIGKSRMLNTHIYDEWWTIILKLISQRSTHSNNTVSIEWATTACPDHEWRKVKVRRTVRIRKPRHNEDQVQGRGSAASASALSSEAGAAVAGQCPSSTISPMLRFIPNIIRLLYAWVVSRCTTPARGPESQHMRYTSRSCFDRSVCKLHYYPTQGHRSTNHVHRHPRQ